MRTRWIAIACVALGGWSGVAMAQENAATAPVPEGKLLATIAAVEGIVQVREGDDGAWRQVTVGMVLGEGAEFRTGPRSAVRFTIPPDQTVTLDRLGTVKLIEAIGNGQKIKTDLGMKYGRVRYDIEAAGLEHDSVIHSPGSALAVRGTRVSLYDQPPFAPEAISFTGRAAFKNQRRQMVAFGGKAKAEIRSGDSSSAQTAAANATIRSGGLATTEYQLSQVRFLTAHQSQILGQVVSSKIPVTNAELPGLLTGGLDFVLRWQVPSNQVADLNLIVRTPKGEVMGNPPFILSLMPNNPVLQAAVGQDLPPTTPSGGRMGLNSIGPAGFEMGSFASTFPKGVYITGAYNYIPPKPGESGIGPKVLFTLEVFEYGHRLPLVLNFDQASKGEEPPVFGFVFHGAASLRELSVTAVQVTDQAIAAMAAATAKHATAKPRQQITAQPQRPATREQKPMTVPRPVMRK
jgi:hypothetical protein